MEYEVIDNGTLNKQAEEKLRTEFKEFKGFGLERVVSGPTLEALVLFCKDEGFSGAVLKSEKTFTECIHTIMKGTGTAISDLEVYQKAAGFYFPNAIIRFQMTIETDGIELQTQEKEIVASKSTQSADKKEATESTQPVPVPIESGRKKITISLDDLFEDED